MVTLAPPPPKHSSLHREWTAYYEAVKGRPPRQTLCFALDRFDDESKQSSPPHSPRTAIDLGCGDGRDTVEMLRRGWAVLAIDGSADAIDRLVRRSDIDLTHLTPQVQKFESLTLPTPTDLVNASFCLPFCTAESFASCWSTIVNCLRSGGRLSGQLYGNRDSWQKYPNLCFHSYTEAKHLFVGFDLEWFAEEEHPGTTPLGEKRDWHVFHFVARKQ